MATPKKRLDATIESLTARVDASPKHAKASTNPLVLTPKHSKPKASAVTPTTSKKVQPYDRSQDLYKRICKGFIDSTRTPPKNKSFTPSKFFKSRTPAAVAPNLLLKCITISCCDEPIDYIRDIDNLKKVGEKTKKKRIDKVETVMPLYNIKAGVDAHEHVEIVADVVEEIFDEATQVKSMKTIRSKKISRECFGGVVGGVPSSARASRSLKRKGSPLGVEASKKRRNIVYNSADSSGDEDTMFISTVKPILSEDEKKEMHEILGKSYDLDKLAGVDTDNDAAKEDVAMGRKRKEGNL